MGWINYIFQPKASKWLQKVKAGPLSWLFLLIYIHFCPFLQRDSWTINVLVHPWTSLFFFVEHTSTFILKLCHKDLFSLSEVPKINSVYGRQRIPLPMRIVAPIRKNPDSRAKFAQKQTFFCAAILDPLLAKVLKSETTSFHYFSPKNSKYLKSLDIELREVGAKRRFNRVNK